MRSILLGLLIIASTSLTAKNMFVVVNSSERVVVIYKCQNRLDPLTGYQVERQIVQSPGLIKWHVVGGLAPYTVIDQRSDGTNFCITVVDAAGIIATGCAIKRTRIEVVALNCPTKEQQELEQQYRWLLEQEQAKQKAQAKKDAAGSGLAIRRYARVEKKGGGSGGFDRTQFSFRSSGSNSKTGGGGGGSTGLVPRSSTGR